MRVVLARHGFNSIKVRLKAELFTPLIGGKQVFQFHKGAIKRNRKNFQRQMASVSIP